MPIKVYKENRAARKAMSIVDRSDVFTGEPQKRLLRPKKQTGGRATSGRMTVRHRGGGVKQNFRVVLFGQEHAGISGTVQRIEYDPNRSSLLALLLCANGEYKYVLAWQGAKPGDVVVTREKAEEVEGNRMQLQHVTAGTPVYNVEIRPGRGGRLFRSAGSYGIIMDIQDRYAQLKMPSGEVRLLPKQCYGTIGKVSNADWRLVRIGSAGRKRRMGVRPSVRGKAMNPVDHPHGGGEGNQPLGMPPKTKWGKPALGVKTRKRGKYSDSLILERRRKKKKK